MIGADGEIEISISADGEIARFWKNSDLLSSSVLQPCKHHTSYLGLLRSRSDPVHKSTVKQDKTSTFEKRVLVLCFTHSFKSAIKPVCERRRASAPTRLQ